MQRLESSCSCWFLSSPQGKNEWWNARLRSVPILWLWMIRMWNKVFKSRFLKGLENQLIYYFYVLVAILILFFLDAIREMQKYSSEEQQQKTTGMSHLDAQMQMHMRLFRAQRNFYIAGYDHECYVPDIVFSDISLQICSLPLLGYQETCELDLSKCRTSGTIISIVNLWLYTSSLQVALQQKTK